MIEVLQPGIFTTVQDLGRPGYTQIGVSPAGAADPLALRVGNLLLANSEGAAALEMTLTGAKLRFKQDCTIAITGADCQATLDDKPVSGWRSLRVLAGQTVCLRSAQQGARAYLCVAGGLAVPSVLGSASTHVLSGLGGHQGRALRKGDYLAGHMALAPRLRELPAQHVIALQPRTLLRVTLGVQADRFSASALFQLLSSTYQVTDNSNRMGLRLIGPALQHTPAPMSSEGMPLGALQVPPAGEPIILFVDAQTTGGYPVIACVISADLASLGQLRPRDQVRFSAVSWEQADALLQQQEALLQQIRKVLA